MHPRAARSPREDRSRSHRRPLEVVRDGGTATVGATAGTGTGTAVAARVATSRATACSAVTARTARTALTSLTTSAVEVTGAGSVSVPNVGRLLVDFDARPLPGGRLAGLLQVGGGHLCLCGDVVSSIEGSADTVTWTGTGTWNGVPGHRFVATAVQEGGEDAFGVVVLTPGGATAFSTGGPQLVRGTVEIHRTA